ncbi:MAG: cysteine--tRNA ligase [Clostridiales bacterium]|jgi:cysteinyl-tRNA synthetase|nr:cysteine--tRNA ligase [Clostridiales bacterium]
MKLKFFNTLSKSKESFNPIGSTVKMYTCGPTVYSHAHIGNMRAYVFMDTLRRTLKYFGYNIFGVLNITDVGHLTDDGDYGDDKITKAAKQQKKQPLEIAKYYTEIFFKDLQTLNIDTPEIIARATDHIDEMLQMCISLVNNGFAYQTEDGIYFDVSKANEYGKLSGDKSGNKAGARVDINSQKRNPQDFALWKIAKPNHIMQWDSPWGASFPGWHIECSAMAHKYLGTTFDIHTGGIDHVPVHHENEIAQSEAFNNCKPANFWMHNEFIQVDGGKMSKSLGTVYTLNDLKDRGFFAMHFKYFCHTTHYRKKLNFTFEALKAANTSFDRVLESLSQHRQSNIKTNVDVLKDFKTQFDSAIADDLNIPLGLGVLHTMLKLPYSISVFELALQFDAVLGLGLNTVQVNAQKCSTIPQSIADIAKARWQFKIDKNFIKADELRKEIEQKGYSIVDQKDSYEIQLLDKK